MRVEGNELIPCMVTFIHESKSDHFTSWKDSRF